MDVYTLTFTYPRPQHNPIPGLCLVDGPNDGPSMDTVHGLCVTTMATFPVSVSYWQGPMPNAGGGQQQYPIDDPTGVVGPAARSFNFMISGAYASVLAARGFILRECPVVTRTSIPVPRSEILDSPSLLAQPSLKPAVRRRLDEVASQTLAHIAVVNPSTSNPSLLPPPSSSLTPLRSPRNFNSHGGGTTPFPTTAFSTSGSLGSLSVASSNSSNPASSAPLEPEPLCHIVITGSSTSPNVAKVRLLVMLDELSGLHAEAIEVDCKLHPIIAGRKRSAIQNIQEETATNIYLPELLRALVGGGGSGQPPRMNENVIWITGEFFGVQRARDMLYQMAHTKTKMVISRDCAILPRKLDWMLTEHLEELKAIMSDHATYLEFPPLGNQASVVSVYGDDRANIHRSIRAIMLLATNHLSAQFYLLPTHFNLLLPSNTINPTQVPPLLKHLGAITNGRAEIVFRDNCFEFYGSEMDVRRGVASVGDIGIVKTFHHEIRFQLELANEHREFISGKKNGKINKIMQLTGCRIRFETLTGNPGPLLSPNGGFNSVVPPSPTRTASFSQQNQNQLQAPMYGGTVNGGNNNGFIAPPQNGQQQQPSLLISVQHPTPNPNSPTTPTLAFSPAQPGHPQHMQQQQQQHQQRSSLTSITNFLITLSGATLPESLQGLIMLLEELPAEISFHVPETYHKRIIGVGGRTIQRIMKKYGVFVKFFNGSAAAGGNEGGGGEWNQNQGGHHQNQNHQNQDGGAEPSGGVEEGDSPSSAGAVGDAEDNVVARTPAKNAANLEHLKGAVLELVNPQDKDFTFETVSIPRRYHRILLGEKAIFIKDIEAKTGSKVRFPDKETASDVVSIYGPESQVHIAAARLLDHVPFEADMTIPNHPDLAAIVASQEFIAFSERMKREFQVAIIPRVPVLSTATPTRESMRRNGAGTPSHKSQSTSSVSSSSTATDDAAFASFKFRCQRSNSDLLGTAREALDGFLAVKGVLVSAPVVPPSPVGSGAFGLGNGGLHSTSGIGSGAGLGVSSVAVGGASAMGVAADFKHRRADSFADAFPHFNSKLLSTANSDAQQRLLSRRIRMATSSPDVKALFNSHSHSPSQVYKLPEHDEQDDAGFQAPSQEGNEYYHPPPRIRHAPSVSFLSGFRNSEDAYKRGSDSRLQEKLKDQSRQRSLTNRAQSLDLTSLSRPDRLSVVRIPSPVDSTNPSSPTSASAAMPSFPSVNGPSIQSNGHSQSNPHYTHQNHYSFPNASYTQPSYYHQHHLSYSRPRTQVSLSSSSSSLSLSSAIEQPVAETDADASVMDDVSRVMSHIRLAPLN